MTSLFLLVTPFLMQARMPLALLATWAHCSLMFSCCHQYPQVPFLLGTVQPHHPQPIKVQGRIVAKMQDSAIRLIKHHPIGLCPSIQPFQVSLQSHPPFQQINTHFQLSVICKFTNERLNILIHVINKNTEQNWPQHRPQRDTTGAWLPAGCSTVHHHSLGLAIQPVPNPAKCSCPSQGLPAYPGVCCGRQWETVPKALLKSRQTTSTALSASTKWVTCGDQVGETRPIPPKSMLAGSDTLAVLHSRDEQDTYFFTHNCQSFSSQLVFI
ncbi:hypothetical protein DUI87_12722 [Hirundo rustica rustica]|uniref:Secreted protein n=1 Tax=Hirundo rustica rustica TaxID=333673 RepID=A0A3M0KA43_HIRRU|nr:hypothetical protein DUI87_12722 [Hirundo rustica rustica]